MEERARAADHSPRTLGRRTKALRAGRRALLHSPRCERVDGRRSRSRSGRAAVVPAQARDTIAYAGRNRRLGFLSRLAPARASSGSFFSSSVNSACSPEASSPRNASPSTTPSRATTAPTFGETFPCSLIHSRASAIARSMSARSSAGLGAPEATRLHRSDCRLQIDAWPSSWRLLPGSVPLAA
jgi:hypothetical protein